MWSQPLDAEAATPQPDGARSDLGGVDSSLKGSIELPVGGTGFLPWVGARVDE
jgi:hypothetical protein